MNKIVCVMLLAFAFPFMLKAQQTVVKGKITERGKNEPMPFVSVAFKGTTIGTTTDFDGNYELKTTQPVDSVVFSFIGFVTQTKKIKRGEVNVFEVRMEPEARTMKEAVIRPRQNPAIPIMNKAIAMRKANNFANLTAYEFDSYNKTDVSLNNISDKLKNNKLLKPLKPLFDTTNQMRNEDGKYIVPIFISETQSRYFYHANPAKSKEIIKANNLIGFGVKEGSYVVDLLGSSLIQFNFNDNWMRFLAKDFISPIAANAQNYYFYTLRDSVDIDGLKCYEIKFELRRPSDLGFNGTVWVADSSFAIRRIIAEISSTANLNFIERLKLQQEQLPTSAGPWIPVKTRVIVELARVTDNTTGFVAKMYRANNNVLVNKLKPDGFFDVAIEREAYDLEKDSAFWQSVRPEQLTAVDQQMYNMIDSVKNLPVVKTYTEVIRVITEGFYQTDKIEFGPYIYIANYNKVEGLRLRAGFRTSQKFSQTWFYNGYLAYGFADDKIKYGFGVDYIINPKRWTTLGMSYKNDYDILGVTDPSSSPIQGFGSGGGYTLATLNMGAANSRINQTIDYRLTFLKQIHRDWTVRLTAQNTYFKPLGDFYFAYKLDETQPETASNLSHDFSYTAVGVDFRFAYKEVLMPRGIRRMRVKLATAPVTTISYTRGIQGAAGGDFSFDKIQINFNQHITTGVLGNADYNITAGKIYGQLPYPMLEVMRGNNTVIYSDNNFSLMNLYEFVADEYMHFWYVQHFEGLFFNRIPVVKNWKLRNYALIKGAYGHLTNENKALIPQRNIGGKELLPIYEFKNEPYLEVGYGIENIFRFVTLGAVHRLTYLNNKDVRSWGINVGLLFQF